LLIALRSSIAVTISKTPRTMAQPAIRKSDATVVISGRTNVKIIFSARDDRYP